MWDQIFTYRLNFSVWRIRQFVRLLALFFLWDAILGSNRSLFGYTRTTMLTYVLVGSFIDAIVFSSQSFNLADEINNGDLSNFLLRPLNYFFYWAAKDVGDKLMNIMFFVGEFALFVLLIRPPFFFQTHIIVLLLFFIAICIAIMLFFFFSILLGMMGFWSSESWAPRFLFQIILSFFAGSLLPLNMFPKTVSTVFQALPFGYLYYFPIRIYLGQASFSEIFTGFAISLFWITLLFLFARYIWNMGLKVYTAQGR